MIRGWGKPLAGGAVAIMLIAGMLGIQHRRHGWPFSLHHGVHVAEPTPVGAGARGAADQARARATVELDHGKLASIGVRIEQARRETISRPLRAVTTIVPDESRISHVHARFAGWIEQLFVNTTGQHVRAGETLAAIFSQELLAGQSEYLAARRAQTSQGISSALAEGARSRLKVLGMTDAEIRVIEQAEEPKRLVSVAAPRAGVVIHRGVSVGTAVDPSTELLTIADLSQVWAIAEVPEADIPNVQRGSDARIEVPGSGRAPIDAKVDFLYPTLSERARTLRVRFVLDNRDGALRPGLYGSTELAVAPREALTVPRDAVVDTGDSQHVFVAEHEGHFVPRAVRIGARLGDRVEIMRGLVDGESIVASGVFLIDSESRLRASGGGVAHVHGASKPSTPAPAHSGH